MNLKPFPYTGNKHKLLSQILPLLPKDVDTIYELFGGSGVISINSPYKNIHYNEKDIDVFNIMNDLILGEWAVDEINEIVKDFKTDTKEGYLELRKFYNKSIVKKPKYLFTLITSSFNNQIRFNKKGEFNLPFGERYFNPKLQEHLSNFKQFINTTDKSIHLTNLDYQEVTIKDNSFVYLDTPYLNSIATYNENKGWVQEDDNRVFEYLDNLSVKWAMSNTFKNSGKENKKLIEWAKKYKIHYLNRNYTNASANKINRSKSIEVLITNY